MFAFANTLEARRASLLKKPKERGPWDGLGEGPLSDRLLEDFSDGPLPEMRTAQSAEVQGRSALMSPMRSHGSLRNAVPERAAMTAQPIHHGETGDQLNKRPEADPLHAYVDNGDLFILDGGVYWRFDSLSAWSRWFDAVQSETPSTQERARQIRAAMDEAYPQDIAA